MPSNSNRDQARNSPLSPPLLELLTAVTEGAPDALFVKDVCGRYLFCNAAGIKLANRTREQILDQDDFTIFGPDAARSMRAQDQRVMQTGMPETETHVIKAGSDTRALQVMTKPYLDRHGQLQGVIVITRNFVDTVTWNSSHGVSLAPAAGDDSERMRSAYRLRESERRLADAQRIAHIGSWGWEPSNGKVWWSRAVYELLGVDPQAIRPSFEAFLELLHPEDRPKALGRVEAMLGGKDRFDDDLRIIRPDGQLIWLHSQAVATRDVNGTILRVEGTHQDITARKLAEADVRASQKFVKAVAETSPLTIYVFDRQQQAIIYSNYYIVEDLGFTPELIQGWSWAELAALVHPDDFTNVTRLLERWETADDQQILLAEYRLRDVHGNWRWFISRDRVFERTSDGRVSQIIGTAEDITERKSTEQSLRESEQRFRELADAIPQIVWVAAPDGGLTYLNAKATEYTGVGMDQLTGWSWGRVIHPEDLPATIEQWTATLEQELPRDMEFRILRTDGTCRWHMTRQVPVREASGAIARWYGTCTDIEDLKRAEQSLRDSEVRFRLLFEGAADAIFWADPETGLLLECNHAAEELLGRDRSEIIGQPQAFLHPPEEADRYREMFRLHASAQSTAAMELVVQRKDGRRVDVSILPSVTLISGRPVIQGIFRDITERKQAEWRVLKSAEFQETIIRTAAEGICVCFSAPEFPFVRFSVWNNRMIELTGYTQEEINRLGWYQSLYPDPDVRRQAELRMEQMREGDDLQAEIWEIIRKDGIARVVTISTSRVEMESGVTGVVAMIQDITERKRAEAESRKAAGLLHAVAEGTSDAIFVKDRDGKYLLANQSACQFAGKPLEHVLGKDDSVLFDAEGARMVLEADREIMQSGRLKTSEVTLTANGVTRSFLSTKAPYRDELGNIIGVIGISHDITARKEVERRLRLKKFSVDHAVDSVFWINSSSEILYVNAAACRTLGYSREEMLGKMVSDIDPNFPPEAWPAHWEELKRRGSFTFESDHATKDGRMLNTEVTVNYLQHEGCEYNCAVMRDITERKRSELEIRQSLSRLHATLESTADGILVVDLEGRIVDFNQQFIMIWGFPLEMINEARKSDVIASFNDHQAIQEMLAQLQDPDGFVRRVREMFQDREKHSFDVLEFKDGRVVERFSRPQRIDGRPVGRVLSFRDVSERRQLEAQLRQSQKMDAVGQLAGGVAHDFNNLLTVINGYCELALSEISSNHPLREFLSAIRHAGERAAALTRQLLTFSRRAIVSPRQIDLNEVIESATKMLRRVIDEDIALVTILTPTSCIVQIDPGQFEQVIMNLALNARDAMPQGGRLTIKTNVVEPPTTDPACNDRFVQLLVTDTGSGMTDEVRSRIFEPFFTTKGVGKGTGLGLATVYGIIAQAGGHIRVESELGLGTTFAIVLPEMQQASNRQASDDRQVAPRGTETILLAEDDDRVRRLTRLMLEAQGYVILECQSGPAGCALAAAHQGPIHLLVTDVVMPDMGGRELAAVIRRDRPEVRVLFVSGYTDGALVRRGVEAEVEAFLQKPFTPLTLSRKVREVLDAAPQGG